MYIYILYIYTCTCVCVCVNLYIYLYFGSTPVDLTTRTADLSSLTCLGVGGGGTRPIGQAALQEGRRLQSIYTPPPLCVV